MNWTTPTKQINVPHDLIRFKQSDGCQKLQKGISEIVQLVQGQKVPEGVLDMGIVTRDQQLQPTIISIELNDNIRRIVDIFENLNKTIDETPPVQESSRFGNRAFRDWLEKITTIILKGLEGMGEQGFLEELSWYFINLFGNPTRIDYGSGHELNFYAFIIGLMDYDKLPHDGVQLLILLSKYYDLCRRIILVYRLEPAGSHGVWGLDDHFHLMFIIGASQYCEDRTAPSVQSLLNPMILEKEKSLNLFANAILFVLKLKSGRFNEHSPVLMDIVTRVRNWEKVRQGLFKMYNVEVLGKFPVIQHFYFGSIYRCE